MRLSQRDPVGAQTLEILASADALNEWIYSVMKPWLKGHVLEVGSGIGNISQFLVRDGFTITLSDYNPDYVAELKQSFAGAKTVHGITSIDLQNENFAVDYAHYREAFDTIFLLNVIEHLGDDELATRICRFMLKPGAHLIVLAPSFQFLYCRMDKELGHYRRYTLAALEQVMLHEGLSVLKKQYLNALGIAGWLVSGKLLGRPALKKNQITLFNRLVPFARFLDRLTGHRLGLSSIVVAKK